jgi:hypothetical protein
MPAGVGWEVRYEHELSLQSLDFFVLLPQQPRHIHLVRVHLATSFLSGAAWHSTHSITPSPEYSSLHLGHRFQCNFAFGFCSPG